MQTRYKPQPNNLPYLENDIPFQLAPGFDPGHVMVTNELEHHSAIVVADVIVATEIPSLPANISHNTHGALNKSPHDISNSMDQSDGDVKLQVLSPNYECYQFDMLIPTQVIPWSQTLNGTCHCATPWWPCGFPH
ncbi:hypothetical protein DSO57_1002149 [Entomophthora muscae]|uniref:Uncharacterized protein n=1 Tax=Entomophthora muscae TaxID=34485 RepID=A0ACC2SLT1_9FUNG|nr:hypothetical protein DSO57_1002149 [Entomophthora muscae]